MMRHTDTLRRSELFAALTDDELHALAPMCADFAAAEGGLVIGEGRQASHLYVVAEGRIALQKRIRAPRANPRQTTITLCYPGEAVGWSALAEPYKYTLSGRAWESSRLVRIEGRLLRRAMEERPALGYKVMAALSALTSRRLRQTVDALISERESALRGGPPGTG